MWSVMIVDDEPKIRRGLQRFIEKAPIPLAVCAQAGDGREAMAALAETQPDIILLDICMPHMNGLELLGAIRKYELDTKVIIITGFSDFSYAQASVSLRAFAYLLKPISEQELLGQLKQAAEELELERQYRKKTKIAIGQLQANERELRRLAGNSWMAGTLGGYELKRQMALWQVRWSDPMFLLVVAADFSVTQYAERELLNYAFSDLVENMLRDYRQQFFCDDCQGCCWVLMSDRPDAEKMKQISDFVRAHFECDCQMELAPVSAPEEMPEAFARAREALSFRKNNGGIAREIDNFIEKNYGEQELSLADLARALRVSPSYLCKLIKQVKNTTFVECLTQKRIEKTVELLRDTDLKLSVIARRVGYTSQHYLSAVFKKNMGVSPSEYRKKQERAR